MKLFLDDVREPVEPDYHVVRTAQQAKDFVKRYGIPDFISFDHDLGEAESGYDFAKWLVNYVVLGQHPLPEHFDYYVHSMNPVGRDAINSVMSRMMEYCDVPRIILQKSPTVGQTIKSRNLYPGRP